MINKVKSHIKNVENFDTNSQIELENFRIKYLGRINKLLGLIFGFVKFATLICIFSFLLEEFLLFISFEKNSVFSESYILPIVSNLNEIILDYLIDKSG